jgi:hypothetical protein
MGRVEKPKTQKEQIDQMWMVLIGSNGDGIVEITKQNHRDIQELKSSIQHSQDSRFSTCPTKIWLEEMWSKSKQAKERKVDVQLVIYGLIVGLVASLPSVIAILQAGGG